MPNFKTIEGYESYLSKMSDQELKQIESDINRELYPDRYETIKKIIAKNEEKKREQAGIIDYESNSTSGIGTGVKFLRILEVPFLNIGVPFFLCVIFKIFSLGTIGPIVLVFGILTVFITPVLTVRTVLFVLSGEFSTRLLPSFLHRKIKGEYFNFLFGITILISLCLGIFLGVLGMNIFIGFTMLFGIMDYQLM